MITSTHNEKIKWLRALQTQPRLRREEAVFVIEGVRLAEEALAAGWPTRLVVYSDELNERGLAVVAGFTERGVAVEAASPQVLRAASDTEAPQGLVAALDYRALPLPDELDFVLIPDRMRDPGNLGTMLRTAAAAGVQALLCPPETVDAFAPKVLRSAMGAHFRLPVHLLEWDEIAARTERLGLVVADAEKGEPYDRFDFRAPLALVVGSEADGAGPQARRLAEGYVRIPMPGAAESLNAAVAAGILMFEAVRQRSRSA